MPTLRPLIPGVFVAGQIHIDDLAEAYAHGIRRIVNNRPDHEEPGQPTSSDLETAAQAAGLDYVHAPVRGMPDPAALATVGAALEGGVPVLLFCKSGMRSAAAWALVSGRSGTLSREDILEATAGAGYELSGLPI
jgi:uncharacterized protein (TIGR01244 family)